MKIVKAPPPNYVAISDTFHLDSLVGFTPVFAYGDTLYNPTGLPISDDLMVHEETHSRQQQSIGAEEWWKVYLKNEGFRLTQEVEAYREQYKFICQTFNRNTRRIALQRLARDLSSPLYGNIIKKHEAEEIIANYE